MAARPDRNRPTLEAVAARAGVSRATVSRVVNGAVTVDPHLVEIVTRAVAELGYVPNHAARALVTARTDIVALVASEPDHRVFGDPFFSAIVRGVSHALTAADVRLMLLMTQTPRDLEHTERYLLSGHVDGALLVSQHGRDSVPATLARAGLPFVTGGRPMRSDVAAPYVDNDNSGGARRAAEHLLALGRTRVGTVTGPSDMSAGVDRRRGFTEGLGARFDPRLAEPGDFTQDGGAAATRRLLERAPDLDALFVANDLMAFGALGALRQAGRQVPGDVAVIGFDDIDLAAAADPALTTVRQRTVEQGSTMAALLLSLLGRGEAPPGVVPDAATGAPSVVLPVELILRHSA